jgi:LPPG:FO 2-phospho-L-lactate transferase
MLPGGRSLSDVTSMLCACWKPGAILLPMSDDRVQSHVVVGAGDSEGALHFQERWMRLGAAPPVGRLEPVATEHATPAPGVLKAVNGAAGPLFPPSNPVVSVGTVLEVRGVADAVCANAAPMVGLSPIVGGAPVRGTADSCLRAMGVETTANAMGRHCGARPSGADPRPAGPRRAAADVCSGGGHPVTEQALRLTEELA